MNINKILSIVIIILILIIIYEHNKNKFLYIDNSLIKNGGRGVFTNKNLKKNKLIDICPYIIEEESFCKKNSNINNYVYDNGDNKVLIVFGNGSMYNHSDDNNVDYFKDTKEDNLMYKTNRKIKKGEELYINYGKDYWLNYK